MKNAIKFLTDYDENQKIIKLKYPSDFNVIDELKACENDHSRILKGLFSQHFNGNFKILDSFTKTLMVNTRIKISSPTILLEKHRIDLLIFEKGKYAIIIENKVNHAEFQKRQLARYIETLIEEFNFKEEDIYVILMPPAGNYSVPKHCWSKKGNNGSYKDSFAPRYFTIRFRDDLLPWLESDVIAIGRTGNEHLSSGIIQYINHLKGKFNLRETDKKMKEEIEKDLKEYLKLTDNPEKNNGIITSKTKILNSLMGELQKIRHDNRRKCFQLWEEQLKKDFPNLNLIRKDCNKHNRVGINFTSNKLEYSVLIEDSNSEVGFGIGKHLTEKMHEQLNDILKPTLECHVKIDKGNKWWYGYKKTSYEDAYEQFCRLINDIIKPEDQ